MSLQVVTNEREIAGAVSILSGQMTEGGERFDTTVGFKGGDVDAALFWREDLSIWSAFEKPYKLENRHWCVFGVDYPEGKRNLAITAEINPPLEGMNRRCAGVVLHDEAGKLYIGHTGNLRGGYPGVGKKAFLAYYPREPREVVVWPNGRYEEIIIVGILGQADLPARVADFVYEVRTFKDAVRSGELKKQRGERPESFSPEFEGKREGYSTKDRVDADYKHGTVVNKLEEIVEGYGYKVANDQGRDVYIYTRVKGVSRVKVLFEIKTDVSTTSIYKGVGQLMLHGAAQTRRPRSVLVLPGKPRPNTKEALAKLGIEVLTYKWRNKQPVFPPIDQFLRGA